MESGPERGLVRWSLGAQCEEKAQGIQGKSTNLESPRKWGDEANPIMILPLADYFVVYLSEQIGITHLVIY